MAGRTILDETGAVVDAEQLCGFPSAVVRTSRPSFYDDHLDRALTDIGLRRKVAVM